MTNTLVSWEEAYSRLESGALAESEICSAIVRLGKPLDPARIRTASSLISKYLGHSNFLVRHEAIWFLGCWGKMSEYLGQIITSAREDLDVDNRAYAARCAGQILKAHKDASAVRSLLQMVNDEAEDPQVRTASYSALLYAYNGEAARTEAGEFEPMGDKVVADFDLSWLASLPQWVEGLPAKTT